MDAATICRAGEKEAQEEATEIGVVPAAREDGKRTGNRWGLL